MTKAEQISKWKAECSEETGKRIIFNGDLIDWLAQKEVDSYNKVLEEITAKKLPDDATGNPSC